MLTLKGIGFSFAKKDVLNDVSASAYEGEVTAIAGPNGVGKSTLLKCIARLLEPSSGFIGLDDIDITSVDRRELARIQAYVPQNTALSFPLTASEYISLGRRPYIDWNMSEDDQRIIQENMEYMGVENFTDSMLDELSGGERQKVLLTRALVQEPRILLLDEPTSALDIRHQLEVMSLLRKIAKDRNCIVVIVLHDLTLIERYSDRCILMNNGTVLSEGKTSNVLTKENISEAYGVCVEIVSTSHGNVVLPFEKV